jgi:transcription termination factor Rho
VTETTDTAATSPTAGAPSDNGSKTAGPKRRTSGLSGMVLPELQQMAQGLGITGTGRMRKSQLIDAIKAAQSGQGAAPQAAAEAPKTRTTAKRAPRATKRAEASGSADNGQFALDETPIDSSGENRSPAPQAKEAAEQPAAEAAAPAVTEQAPVAEDRRGDQQNREPRNRDGARDSNREGSRDGNRDANRDGGSRDRDGNREGGRQQPSQRDSSRDGQRDSNRDSQRDSNRDTRDTRDNRDDDEEGGGRRRRRRARDRFRDRDRGGDRRGGQGGGQGGGRERFEPEPQVNEDDVLIPVAGILDVLENYAFVRTSGFMPGPNDVYVSLAVVKRYGLRKGDAITGAIRQPKDGERREKFNPLVRVDTVNGADPDLSKARPEFGKLTPLYPQERLRLETEASNLTGRVIDLVSPIGKGQRGMIVSPSKAGKTLIMQSIANSITTNNPEVHLMVVLVDERPEEVTDFQRAVKGEVIASTFDRPAEDHTTVAELAIERAKRLVELGHDVVVLLDGITRLGRAYNQAAPASGRILSGGVDSSALYPPKKFFGAARNIENGGSLTILATALVETGSRMDEVIFEEFKGTGNMEVRLKRDFADKRIFPAIDVDASSTRREELLMGKEELAIVWRLRRVLGGLDGLQALELLLGRLKDTKSNVEFLMQINKSMPLSGNSGRGGNGNNDDD